ncbi:MAG: chloramphenicol acetyltransferase, partial [Bacteroidales bacterium]|nr:chloramphenicol acetyltransferase [Bacteroidales bacterium]
EIIEKIPTETDPYAAENQVNGSKHKFMDMILVAANPGLNFSSMTCTQSGPHGSEKPLINVGKAVKKEGKIYIPVFISVHHGLCDGYHVTKFYQKTEEYLKEL